VAMFQLRDGGEGRRQQGRRGGRAAASASPAVASADFIGLAKALFVFAYLELTFLRSKIL